MIAAAFLAAAAVAISQLSGGTFPSLCLGVVGDMTISPVGSSSSLLCGDVKNGPGGFFGGQ
eukprot:1261645-Amphidinium_carterae.1